MTPNEVIAARAAARHRKATRRTAMETMFGVIFALGADFGKVIAWTTIAVFTARYWGVPI